jgi:hypothetical protein
MEVSGQLHYLVTLTLGKEPWYPLDMRLGGVRSWSGRGGEEKNPFPCRESNTGRPAHTLITVLSYSYAVLSFMTSGTFITVI